MKIISGGQTGADQGALEGAVKAGFETGGFAPKGYKTEKGNMPELGEKFHMLESSSTDYIYRTNLNAKNSDFTIWFGDTTSPGGRATIKSCKGNKRDFYDVSTWPIDDIVKLIKDKNPKTLNVAGNRESKGIGIQERVKDTIYNVLIKIKKGE